MQIRIALDPQLELTAAEFAAAWNVGPHAADAPAAVVESAPESFLSPELTIALITALVGIPVGVITDFVTEYLKKKYIDKPAPKVTVTTLSTPDGTPLLVIKQEEK